MSAKGLYRVGMERVKGIEPSSSAWEAAALPLSYTRVGVEISVLSGVVKGLAVVFGPDLNPQAEHLQGGARGLGMRLTRL